jgi:hypothetical protein
MTRCLRRASARAPLGFATLAAAALLSAPAAALPLISEVLYDPTGTDNGFEFIELYGAPGTILDGFVLEGVNGADGSVTPSILLAGTIPADGFFVVADDDGSGASGVVDVDLVVNFALQNGPDSIVLRDAGDVVVDAVGYGVFLPTEFFAGEGMPTPDPVSGWSIARTVSDVDTDDNFADFTALELPTPGAGVTSVPEPGAGGLLATALGTLALIRARPRHR